MRPFAHKLKIEDLVLGRYVRPPESTEPGHVLTPWGDQVFRARILGTVVEKFLREDHGYAVLRLDDGTETITVRAWGDRVPELVGFNPGDLVDVLGRVREFGGEVYLVPDLIIRVEDPNWELVRELEILRSRKQALAAGKRPQLQREMGLEPTYLEAELRQPVESVSGEEVEEPALPQIPDELKKRALLALGKLGGAEGVDLADLAAELDIPLREVEEIIRALIIDGEVFEPRAGKFKRVG